MAESKTPHLPTPPGQGAQARARQGTRQRVVAGVLAIAAVIVGTALLGAVTGLVWAAIAPRPALIVVGRDAASVLNPETSAFIAADGWYTILCVIAGVVSGVIGYLAAVRRYGPAAMAGVLAGAVAAAVLARWVGEQAGGADFSHRLASAQAGAVLRGPLQLGSHGALAFWPLAAALTAGGIEAFIAWRERRRAPGAAAAQAR